ncbi:hypothetical protein GGS21DRAFT_508679 [Xylaria nigripes]|nr:hypothetical protein GGS21DRAFT_508679 [Xylaria nigripes]
MPLLYQAVTFPMATSLSCLALMAQNRTTYLPTYLTYFVHPDDDKFRDGINYSNAVNSRVRLSEAEEGLGNSVGKGTYIGSRHFGTEEDLPKVPKVGTVGTVGTLPLP